MPSPTIPEGRRLSLSADRAGRAMDIDGTPVPFPNPLPLPPALPYLLSYQASLAVWDVRDASTITRPTGGNPAAPTDTVGTLRNQIDAAAFDLLAPTAGQAPQWQNGAIDFGGTDDYLYFATNPAAVVDLICVYKGTDSSGCLWSTNGASNRYVGGWGDGSSNVVSSGAGAPSYVIDGTAFVGTFDDLHSAIADGQAHVIEIRNVSLSVWAGIVLGTLKNLGGAFYVLGKLLPIAILNSAAADIAVARKWTKRLADEIVTDLGL